MCDVSPRLVNSTLGNYWARSFTQHITVVLFQKNTFQRLKSFFWLVGRSCNASIWSPGDKTFQPVKSCFSYISSATAFGWGLGSIALACHGFASAGAATLGSALSPLLPALGMFPADTPMTIPWPSQVWLRHHSQSHGALSHPNPQPNAVGPQQYVWMCEKKLFAGWKVFSPPDLRSIATATRQPEITFQLLKRFFWPFPLQKVSK